MKKVVTPFRVGLLVIVAGGILFFFLSFVRKGGMREDESVRLFAYFRDAFVAGRRTVIELVAQCRTGERSAGAGA